jgi:hypothetical protein
MVIGAIVEMGVEGVLETARRREKILRLLEKLGCSLENPPPDFDGLYAYTLVEYGVGKPAQVLELFRYKPIREAFRRTFEQRDRTHFDDEVETFLDSEIGENYHLDYDPKRELAEFQAVFVKLADRARTVIEVKQDQKLEDIHQAVQRVLDSLAQRRRYTEPDKGNQGVRGAALDLRIGIHGEPRPVHRPTSSATNRWVRLRLDVAVTSTNSVASEEGALKLIFAYPVEFSNATKLLFSSSYFQSTGLRLKGYDVVPHARSLMIRWGGGRGTVIFPGDWHDFYGNSIYVDILELAHLAEPTYLFRTELFTVNSTARRRLYSMQQGPRGGFRISEVRIDAEGYRSLTQRFWTTYHAAREMLLG